MVYAVVERCPVFGGKVASFDDTKTKAVPGVKQVVQISSGVAVIADNTWAAMEGRSALTVQWDEGKGASHSAGIGRCSPISLEAGAVARNEGTPTRRWPTARRKSRPSTKRRISRTLPWSR